MAEAACVLDNSVHDVLIRDLDRFAAQANVPTRMVRESAKTVCSKDELDWLANLRQHMASDKCGAVMLRHGDQVAPIETRMMAMTAACLRNFIDARFATVQSLLMTMKSGGQVGGHVLFIPNFYMDRQSAGDAVATWQRGQLLDLLYTRQSAGDYTVVYVGNMDTLEKDYGKQIAEYLSANFDIL